MEDALPSEQGVRTTLNLTRIQRRSTISFTESNPRKFVKFRQQLSDSTRMQTKSTVLTREERGLLILATLHGQQLSNSEISQRLGVSVSRVKRLVHLACVKLEAHNRAEAIVFALKRGEISLNDIFSLDELAEILSLLSPDTLIMIAHLVRQELELGHPRGKDEQIIRTDRRQDAILTNRERDVLIIAGHGLTNKEIADRLCISIGAVTTFLNRACRKLGARRRTDAVVLALKQREISAGEILSLYEMLQFLAPLGAESIEKIAQLLSQKLGQEPIPTGS
jgi:DNA-binding NarL/FixJ family response regulator